MSQRGIIRKTRLSQLATPRPIVNSVGSAYLLGLLKHRRSESASNLARPAIPPRRLGFEHDFQNVKSVFGAHHWLSLPRDAFDQMAQPFGPWPVRLCSLKELPATCRVLPQFVTARVPFVP